MSLSNYAPEQRKVALGDSFIQLGGLSLEHVAILMREHLSDLDQLWSIFSSAREKSPDDFAKIAMAVVSQAPGFAANLIALAAGEPGAAANAMSIPAPKQIEIIVTIGELTFTEVGGVKKGMETIASLLVALKPEVAKKLTETKTKAK